MKIEEIKDKVRELLIRIDKSLDTAKSVVFACNAVNNSWSGSDLVGHANLFYGDFEVPQHGRRFSVEWGLIHGIPSGWGEKSNDEVLQKIEEDLNVSVGDLDKEADSIADEFEKLRKQTIIIFSDISKDAASEIEKFSLQTKIDIFNQYWKRQIVTRDSGALYAGRQVPTHKYYCATASFFIGGRGQLEDFLHSIDKVLVQHKNLGQTTESEDVGRNTYVDQSTLLRLRKIESDDFDLIRLLAFCNELDDNYSLKNYHACAMLLRAIVDHIPPVFGQKSFSDVCAQHGGKSFKDILRPLNETAKKIGDDYLHTQIGRKILAVTKTQVSFQANLDTLLNEVAAILEKK